MGWEDGGWGVGGCEFQFLFFFPTMSSGRVFSIIDIDGTLHLSVAATQYIKSAIDLSATHWLLAPL